jgi:hypothetical protein
MGKLWAHFGQMSSHSDSRANELERIWKCLWPNRGIILDFTWEDPSGSPKTRPRLDCK